MVYVNKIFTILINITILNIVIPQVQIEAKAQSLAFNKYIFDPIILECKSTTMHTVKYLQK